MSKSELLERARNNFEHHPPCNDLEIAQHETVREVCRGVAKALIDICPESRELSLALTNLEQAMFWANAALARNKDGD